VARARSLHLRNGVVIEDPLADALGFIEYDGTYQGYDSVPVDPWELTELDLRLANRMIARMGPTERAAALGRRRQVARALREIPLSSTLASPAEAVPWKPLAKLLAALEGLPGIRLARATKVLHKKRPALVPILDEVVVRYLEPYVATAQLAPSWGARPSREPARPWAGGPDRVLPLAHGTPRTGGDLSKEGIALTRAYHAELQRALPVLAHVRDELAHRGFDLTECRLLDIYLWAYSGTYEPLWRRRQMGSAENLESQERSAKTEGSALLGQPAPPAQAAKLLEFPGPELFWRDDKGYLAWLHSHPEGCAVNCDHEPKARYLKLHRTSCPHLHLRNVNNWTDPYMKVCAQDVSLLDQWAQGAVGTVPDRCPVCKPFTGTPG
jgi:hypothetical protein